MKPGIKITTLRTPEEDGFVEFEIIISNLTTHSTLSFWEYKDSLNKFADELIKFPINIKHKVKFEIGQEKNEGQMKWAYYLLLDVFYHSSGKSVIKIITNNKFDIPNYDRTEFYIQAESASINKLGASLKNWNPNIDNEFEWIAYSE